MKSWLGRLIELDKYKMGKMFFIAFFLLATFSCNTHKNKALNEIEALRVQVDSMLDSYNSIDWKGIQAIKMEMDENQSFITKHFEALNLLDTQLISYFGPYADANKLISRAFKKKRPGIESEINFTQLQLSNLSHDIKHKVIQDADSISIYIKSETKSVSDLKREINEFKKTVSKQVEAYQLLHGKVDSIINLYNTKPE